MHTVIHLESGGNVSLSGANPMVSELVVGFGWEIVSSNSPAVELVPCAILCDKRGRAITDDSMVFFNQLSTPSGAVSYVTQGDLEQIEVSLALIPVEVEKLVFVVYVDPDVRKPGTFASVRRAYIRIADRDDTDIARFALDRTDGAENAMIFGEIYRYKGTWKFRAVGEGYVDGISGVARNFGLAL
jgi:tellurium resistance protein TerD